MDQKSIIQDFETAFAQSREQLGFSATLEELDAVFNFRYGVLQLGFVPLNVPKYCCSRIIDLGHSWIGQLHAWITPNPASLISLTENDVLSDIQKAQARKLLKVFMALGYENTTIAMQFNEVAQGKFIDSSLQTWNTCKDELIALNIVLQNYWQSSINVVDEHD